MPQSRTIEDPFADLATHGEEDPFADLTSEATPKTPPVALVLPDLPRPPMPPPPSFLGMEGPRLDAPSTPRLLSSLPQGRTETMALEGLSRLKDINSGLSTLMARNQPKTLDERLGGASKAARAGMELALPVIVGSVIGNVATRGIPALVNAAIDFGGGTAIQQGVERGAEALGAGPGTASFIGDVAGLIPIAGGMGSAVERRLRTKWDAPRTEANRLRTEAVKAQAEIPQGPGASWAEINDAIQSAKTIEEKAASARAALLKASETVGGRLKGWGSLEPLTNEVPKTPQGHTIPGNRQLGPAPDEALPSVNPEGMIAERAPSSPEPFIADFDVPRFVEGATKTKALPGTKLRTTQEPGTLIEAKGGSRVLEDNIAVEDALFGPPPEGPSLVEEPWTPEPLDRPKGLLDVLNDKALMDSLPREDRESVRRQVESMFYRLGYSRQDAIAKGLPKDSMYLGPSDFPRGAPSAKAWRALMDARETAPKENYESTIDSGGEIGIESPSSTSQNASIGLDAKAGGVSASPPATLTPLEDDIFTSLSDEANSAKPPELKYQTVPSVTPEPQRPPLSTLSAEERELVYRERETKLQEALPGLKVTRDPGRRSLWVRAPGGAASEIRVSESVPSPFPDARVTGAYRPRSIDFQPLIQLTDEGITSSNAAPHEAFHWAWDTLLYPKERKALVKAYGSEEGAASAFNLKGNDENLGILRSRINAIREAIAPSAPGVMARLERTNRSSIWERRQMGLIDDSGAIKPSSITIAGRTLPKIDLHSLATELKDKFTSGGNTFGDDPQLWSRVVAPTVAKPKWRNIVTNAGPEIAKALEPFHASAQAEGRPQSDSWDVLRDALIEGRLVGVRNRFSAYASEVQSMSDGNLASGWKRDGDLRAILKTIDKGGTSYEAKAIEANREGKLREYLASLFNGIASQVPSVDLMGKYGLTLEELAGREEFQSALAIYKNRIETPAREQHLANEGWISSHLGPLNTWYPLLPLDRHTPAGFLSTGRRRETWYTPENPLNFTSLGNAKSYDPSISALVDRLGSAEGLNRRAQLMKGLIDDGFAVEGSGDIHDSLSVRGIDTPVRTYALATKGGYSLAPTGGKAAPRWVAIPEALASKIEHIVLTPNAINRPGALENIVDGVNAFSLLGPFDNRYHIQSVLSGIVEGTPWLKMGGRVGNLLGNIPAIKNIAAMKPLVEASMELRTPEGQSVVQRMIKEGAWNPRVGQVTMDPKLAKDAGIDYLPTPAQKDYWTKAHELSPEDIKVLSERGDSLGWAKAKNTIKDKAEGLLGPLAYGPHGIDASVRYSLYKWHLSEFPDAPIKDRVDFVNQIANYNWALQSEFERTIKRSLAGRAMAPFYTMGSTLVRNGIRMATGQVPGLPEGNPMKNALVRVASAGTGGVVAWLSAWALANKSTTGEWPWDDKGKGRLGYVRVPNEYLKSHPNFKNVVEAVGGEAKGGDEYYLPLGWSFTWTQRGSQVLGTTNAFNAVSQGARDGSQIFWESFRGPANVLAHPITSGGIPQMISGATGVRPYVPSMYDREGKLTFTNLMERRAPARSTAESIGLGMAKGLTGANQLSEAIADIGTAAILDRPVDIGKMGASMGNPMFKTLWEIMIPRSAPVKYDVQRQKSETRRVEIGRHRQQAKERAKVRRAQESGND